VRFFETHLVHAKPGLGRREAPHCQVANLAQRLLALVCLLGGRNRLFLQHPLPPRHAVPVFHTSTLRNTLYSTLLISSRKNET
jgi:hypothetical protein